MSQLQNTAFLLKQMKKLNVAYFGGSITDGSGASDMAKTCWRALTTKWFRAEYPDCEINEIHAAIGGTGSVLGAFRMDRDLLPQKPDLVFVEFAVNDFGTPKEYILPSMEGIVRKIRLQNLAADIVFIYTLTKRMHDWLKEGNPIVSKETHQAVANHYGIPSVDVGILLAENVDKGIGDWTTYCPDLVHPNDHGYAIYTEKILAFLKESLPPAEDLTAHQSPAPLSIHDFTGAHLYDTWNIKNLDGWEKVDKTMSNRYPHMIWAKVKGTELRLSFTGTFIGLLVLISSESGDFLWSVDGSEPKRVSTWDQYALSFDRPSSIHLTGSLPEGKHELLLTVLDEKPEQSKGTYVKIGAVMTTDASLI